VKKKRTRSLKSRLKRYNIKQAEFDSHKVKFARRFGREPSDRDVIWGILNNRVTLRDQGPHALKMTYRLMALVLHDEGKDPLKLLQESAKAELIGMQNTPGVTGVQICNSTNPCPACQELKGQTFTIDEALKKMPLPNKNCTCEYNGQSGWCRCFYIAVLMDSDEFMQRVRGWLKGEDNFLDDYRQFLESQSTKDTRLKARRGRVFRWRK
jgi:hypothetical protein